MRVEAESPEGRWSADVAGRGSMQEPGSMVYLPAGCRVKLSRADGAARITIAGAAGKPGLLHLAAKGPKRGSADRRLLSSHSPDSF